MTDGRPRIEELDWQQTAMGELLLRRRVEPATGHDVYEVRLGEEYLMSSAFTVAERELAGIALDSAHPGELSVLVGGLGLGYTAAEALLDRRVAQLVVVEALAPVVDWHARHLLPASRAVVDDPRCSVVQGDFFAHVRDGTLASLGDPPGFDAILLDVDHTPTHHLDPSHADFYTEAGLGRLAAALRPGGVFGLWSDDTAGADFLDLLGGVIGPAEERTVHFENPVTGGTSSSVVYVARS